MRQRFLPIVFLVCASYLHGQADPPQTVDLKSILPDAPSITLQQHVNVVVEPAPPLLLKPVSMPPLWDCPRTHPDCPPPTKRQYILNMPSPFPRLSPLDKLKLAGRDIIDPFNFAVIGMSSAIFVAANPNSAYGAGWKGFGKNYGVAMTGDVTGEFFSTFLIPSIAHQDPRYHRSPDSPLKHRIWRALSHTIISQDDDGKPMPNYATLLTYPINTELANAYAPGIQRDSKSVAKRVLLGYATDPVGGILAEFLPDVAKRIHVRVVFFQEILNQIATDPTMAQ